MSIAQPSSQPFSPAPVTTAAEAERLAAHFIETMDTLVAIVQRHVPDPEAKRQVAQEFGAVLGPAR